MNTPDQFNAAWLAAQPVDVQLLVANTPVGDARTAALDALAAKYAAQTPPIGLDEQILEAALPAYWVMQARVWYGYYDPNTGKGWVPAIGQPFITLPPGETYPGRPTYDPDAAPAGSVKVVDPTNCNLAVEYPPAIPPAPPMPAPSSVPLVDLSQPWPDQGPNAFYATWAGRSIPDGTTITEDGKQWVKISVGSMFVPYEGWKLVA